MTTFNFNTTSARRYIPMLTAVLACLAAGIASADDGGTDNLPTAVVSLAGLDLSTSQGADMVYDRIRSAAKMVCRVNESRELAQVMRARDCFRSSVDDAIAQANRPLLSDLHARRMGKDPELMQSASR